MDPKVRELLTRLFIADADMGGAGNGSGYYDESEACRIVGELRACLEAAGQWDWSVDAEPLLAAGEGK